MSNTTNRSLISKEDLISMFLGLAIVGIVMVVLVNYFKSKSGRVDLDGVVDIGEEQVLDSEASSEDDMSTGEYVVKPGDSLWNIAVMKYDDGYKWAEIADANGIDRANASQIEVGQKIVLPDTNVGSTDLPTEHVVIKGESLSKIALNYYGDMFAWEKIYQANISNINDPNLIEIGMTLVIPE